MNDKLSQLTTPQLLAVGLAAVMTADVRAVLEVDAEMGRRNAAANVMVKEDEFFTMESKQATMKVLHKVMS